MSIAMQKQTARNLVLSPNAQAAYGGVLADGNLTRRASIDPSVVFMADDERYNDQGAAGHGTDYATGDVRTAWDTSGTLKGFKGVDSWMLGFMMAFIAGTDTVTGAGPYTHALSLDMASALAPCTTVYVEDTADIHRKYPDMAAKSLEITIPERGVIEASMDFVGTGRFIPGSFGGALPAIPTPVYLLGSDVGISITPNGGGANSLIGRQRGVSFKLGRNTAPWKSSGDGLTAGSCQYGKLTFSLDFTVMAKDTDDMLTIFESMTPCNISVATNNTLAQQLILNFPLARFKATRLGNEADLVAWKISLDQSTCLQNGAAAAFNMTIINTAPTYLIPA